MILARDLPVVFVVAKTGIVSWNVMFSELQPSVFFSLNQHSVVTRKSKY